MYDEYDEIEDDNLLDDDVMSMVSSVYNNEEIFCVPENIKELDTLCFAYNVSIRVIYIPKTVERIYSYCFNECTNLEKVIFDLEENEYCSKSILLHNETKEIKTKMDFLRLYG